MDARIDARQSAQAASFRVVYTPEFQPPESGQLSALNEARTVTLGILEQFTRIRSLPFDLNSHEVRPFLAARFNLYHLLDGLTLSYNDVQLDTTYIDSLRALLQTLQSHLQTLELEVTQILDSSKTQFHYLFLKLDALCAQLEAGYFKQQALLSNQEHQPEIQRSQEEENLPWPVNQITYRQHLEYCTDMVKDLIYNPGEVYRNGIEYIKKFPMLQHATGEAIKKTNNLLRMDIRHRLPYLQSQHLKETQQLFLETLPFVQHNKPGVFISYICEVLVLKGVPQHTFEAREHKLASPSAKSDASVSKKRQESTEKQRSEISATTAYTHKSTDQPHTIATPAQNKDASTNDEGTAQATEPRPSYRDMAAKPASTLGASRSQTKPPKPSPLQNLNMHRNRNGKANAVKPKPFGRGGAYKPKFGP